jgi:hypothetical protein
LFRTATPCSVLRREFYGLAPTGRSFRVPVIAVFFFQGDRVVIERIY